MFTEKPASKRSISRRKLIYGVGLNDAFYMTRYTLDNNRFKCPYYVKWIDMIRRCYSSSFHKKRPTYKDCSVCDEWLIFTNFRKWMIKQDWNGKHLDKDILIQGNRVYSPDACMFVTHAINSLLTSRRSNGRGLPVGVHLCAGKFKVEYRNNGRIVYLGLFESEDRASKEYKKEKYLHIKRVADQQKEPLKGALLAFIIK